eukprot:TRINITY_DN34828_c0_g1_i1.p1 TRINITY_DN34828_c0_g1~~TRINITY_DN34828_c0_g1_i1.p1  ORF type:complete len:516 (-),score=71.10 TRINITY_DN34828_c0_g1_i1:178-1725(-)
MKGDVANADGNGASTLSDIVDAAAYSSATAVDAINLIANCGRLPLPGGLVVDVRRFGPPISVADIAPTAGRIFVAASHAVVGFSLTDLRHCVSHKLPAPSPQVSVPLGKLPGASLRVRCGVICTRPVVAVADCRGEILVFLADLLNSQTRALRLSYDEELGGGLDFVDGGPHTGFLFAGNSSGQLVRWRLAVGIDGESLHDVQCLAIPGAPRDTMADALIVDLHVRNGKALVAALDGQLEVWSNADGKLLGPPSVFVSSPSSRIDCSECPSLWGARWVPLSAILKYGSIRESAVVVQSPANLADIPADLVRRRVLPFIPLSDMACCVALLSRSHQLAVQLELMDHLRNEHLAICFSDCTAWLLDERLRVLARQDLPFCASHAHVVPLAPVALSITAKRPHMALSTLLVAPKTDLVAVPGAGISVMPHVWALACSSSGGLRCPKLHVRRLDLLPEEDAVTAAALVAPADRSDAGSAATSLASLPRDVAHVLGLGICEDQLWTFLASSELLLHSFSP